jgi:hypothetical protein
VAGGRRCDEALSRASQFLQSAWPMLDQVRPVDPGLGRPGLKGDMLVLDFAGAQASAWLSHGQLARTDGRGIVTLFDER